MTLHSPEKLNRFTVVPHQANDEPNTIIIAPPEGDLDHAFDLAKLDVDRGRSVRLVGHGVVFSQCWPQWVHTTRGLSISELGGYWSRPNAEVVLPLLEPIRRWIDETFAGAVAHARQRDVFYAQTCHRLVQLYIDAYPAAAGLFAAHPNATFVCAMPSWPGVEILHALGAAINPTRNSATNRFDGVRVFATGVAALPIAIARMLESYLRGHQSRRELRSLRSRLKASARSAPKRWAAVYADWPRLSRHTLSSVGLNGKVATPDAGVLFIQTLARGLRIEDGPLRTSGNELWPTTTPLRAVDPDIVIDQAVLPESPLAFGRALFAGVRSSLQTIVRASRRPRLDMGGALSLSLGEHAAGFAKLATLDILRATAASRAATDVCNRWPIEGTAVAFSLANTSELAAVDVALQAAGATTIELTHGTGEDTWVGQSETPSTIWSVWTRPDTRTLAALKRRMLVAGMPLPTKTSPRTGQTRGEDATRVLFLSNYLHRDRVQGRFPNELYADELVEVAALLQTAKPDAFRFHWRPHPREDVPALRTKLKRIRGVTISEPLKTTLSMDLQNADLVIASVSTSMVEALVAGLPVFVHVAARVSGLPATSSFDESRQFFYAREGMEKVLDYSRQLLANEDASAPETHALRELFGPTMWPGSLLSMLGEQVHPTEEGPRPVLEKARCERSE